MFRKISLAALAASATIALAAGPASALRSTDYSSEDTTYSYEPTGTRTVYAEKPHGGFQTGDENGDCIEATKNANSWQVEALKKYEAGDDAWKQAQNNADAIAGQANADWGCTITNQE
jgi:hypothetical protein